MSQDVLTPTSSLSLESYGIKGAKVHWNLPPAALQEATVNQGIGTETAEGVLTVNTGKFTGRSPKDRYLVKDQYTGNKTVWGRTNQHISPAQFEILYQEVSAYLSDKALYVLDQHACTAPEYSTYIRTVCEYPWTAFFVDRILLNNDDSIATDFKEDWLILCAPGFEAQDPKRAGLRQRNFTVLNFSQKIALVGGSAYTGEIKKGIFSILNLVMPLEHEVLPMHCAANVGADGDTALFFGLSGSGKTTLVTDPNRKLLGDDAHGWAPNDTVFNFEGGCCAKALGLTESNAPEIFKAIKPGALLENTVFEPGTKIVDYADSSITHNTRASYPIHHISNIYKNASATAPKHVFFLTCDAFGVLPPVSKLTHAQAAYHFLSGYTAKVAGTEAGVKAPVPSFSACFGEPFMPLHPTVYADMLNQKMIEVGTTAWLVNTGWYGGPYGVGERIDLDYTKAIITAILQGALETATYRQHPIFGLFMPQSCSGVPAEMLNPVNTWGQKHDYISKAIQLAHAFHINFDKFIHKVSDEVMQGGPLIDAHQLIEDYV